MPFPPRRPLLAALLGAASLSAASPAVAEQAPPFAALLAQARANAPRLAEAEAEVTQAEGRNLQEAARQNPVLSLEVENFAGSGPYEDFEAAETTASIAQTLELGGKRSTRIEAGRAGVTAAQARAARGRSEFASDLAIAYAEAEASAAKVVQAEETLAAADADARAARELVDAGREAELRALQAAAERDAARAEREEASAARDAAFVRLSTLAGTSIVYEGVSGSLLNQPPNSDTAMPGETPAILAARTERDAAASRVRVESRKAVPDVTFSAGVRRFGDDATALVGGVSVPLPLFDQNRGATQAARGELMAAEARLRQAELEAVANFRTARFQARSAVARVSAALAGEAAATEAYRLARIGYEAGRVQLIELTNSRRALADARVGALDARLAQVRAEAEIARLTGRTPFGG